MVRRVLPGINIQYPISRMILDGIKTIETRTYPIPQQYVGKEMLIVETPGPKEKFKARLVGTIVFGESFQYNTSKVFYSDKDRHQVTPDSPWRWVTTKPKWGWPILRVQTFKKPKAAPSRRGIKFTLSISY